MVYLLRPLSVTVIIPSYSFIISSTQSMVKLLPFKYSILYLKCLYQVFFRPKLQIKDSRCLDTWHHLDQFSFFVLLIYVNKTNLRTNIKNVQIEVLIFIRQSTQLVQNLLLLLPYGPNQHLFLLE